MNQRCVRLPWGEEGSVGRENSDLVVLETKGGSMPYLGRDAEGNQGTPLSKAAFL